MSSIKKFEKFKEKEQLNEGLIQYANDLYMAFRIVKILYQDWIETKAFKLGIIDAEGNKIRAPENAEERFAYSPFMRLCFRIKRLLNMIPGGKSKIGSMAAAYALLRESDGMDLSVLSKEDLDSLFEEELAEDAPVNVSGGVAGADAPIGKVQRRNWKDQEKFAGHNVFDVEPCTYQKCRNAKQKYERWDKYISEEDGEVGSEILKYAKTYPGKGIVVRERGTDAMVFLKIPKV